MDKIDLKCPECSYVFAFEIGEDNKEVLIQCPYCEKKGNYSNFEDMNQIYNDPVIKKGTEYLKELLKDAEFEVVTRDFGTGYQKTLYDLKDVLKDASGNMVKSFFEEDVKVFTALYKDGRYIFTDSDGKEVSIEEVHEYIQNDVVLQRNFYNWWMSMYR